MNACNILYCSLDTYYISCTIKQTIYFFKVKQTFFDVLFSKHTFYPNWNIFFEQNKQIVTKKCVDYGKIPYFLMHWFDDWKCITMPIAPRINGLEWSDIPTSCHYQPNTQKKKAVFWETVLVLASKHYYRNLVYQPKTP